MTLVWLVVVQLREPPTDDMSEANQPPPSPVPTSSRVDNHLLPAVKPEAETTDQKPADPQQVGKPEPDSKPETAAVELKPVSGDQPVKVPSISPTGSEAVVKDTTEKEEKEEREKEEEKAEEKEGGKEEAIEEEAGKVPEGARLGCKLDLGAGTLTFYLNGVQHGPGWTGIVGPVKRCVEFYHQGDSVTLVRTEPAFRD